VTSDHEMRGKESLRDPAIATAAIDWFVRQQAHDMPGDDWLAFSDWLGEDARHGAAGAPANPEGWEEKQQS